LVHNPVIPAQLVLRGSGGAGIRSLRCSAGLVLQSCGLSSGARSWSRRPAPRRDGKAATLESERGDTSLRKPSFPRKRESSPLCYGSPIRHRNVGPRLRGDDRFLGPGADHSPTERAPGDSRDVMAQSCSADSVCNSAAVLGPQHTSRGL